MYESEPRSVGGVLDAGVRLYRAAFARVMVTAAQGFAVLFLLEVVFELTFGVSTASVNATDPAVLDPGDVMVYFAMVPFMLLISFGTTAAIVVHLHRIAASAADPDAGVWGEALRRCPAYLGVLVLYTLAILLGSLLLLIPGVWLSIALLPALYLVFTERLGPIAACRRAFGLVRGNWWRTATIVLVASLIVVVIQAGIVSLPAFFLGVLAASGDGEVGLVWVLALDFLNAGAQALSIPLAMAMALAVVRDLTLRASGEDLEARLDAAGG